MFGLVSVNSVEIKYPSKDTNNEYAYTFPGGNHATSVVEGVGMFLFALYHVAIIIVLINMLIAMMSHSFEDIQVTGHRISLSLCYYVTAELSMIIIARRYGSLPRDVSCGSAVYAIVQILSSLFVYLFITLLSLVIHAEHIIRRFVLSINPVMFVFIPRC